MLAVLLTQTLPVPVKTIVPQLIPVPPVNDIWLAVNVMVDDAQEPVIPD
jgi:hypothetical protein